MEPTGLQVSTGSTAGTWRRRAAASSGALFTVGVLVGDDGINRAGEAPSPFDRGHDSLTRVEDYLAKAGEASADGNYWAGRGIGTLALVALLVFSVYVARQVRRHERPDELTAGVVLGAGLVASGLGLVSCTAQFAVVSRATHDIDLQVARALLDFSSLTFVAMWLPLAVFVAAVAESGRRHSLVPPWFTVTSGVVAVALMIGLATMPLSNAGFGAVMLGFLWFIAASVVLVRRATEDDAVSQRSDDSSNPRRSDRGEP